MSEFEVRLRAWLENQGFDCDVVFDEDAQKTIIGKMRAEIAEEIIDEIVKDLETDICFVIVACLDEQAAQKEDKEE